MIGEQSRRDDRQRMYWVVQRAGIFAAVISMIGLLILFAYSRIRQGYNPTFWMLAMAAVGAAGVVAAFWAYTESRRE